jgi:hypothetical protein
MTKEFVNYEQALALKELGFDEPCFGLFDNIEPNEFYQVHSHASMGTGTFIKAPLYDQAFRWLLEKHYLYAIIIPTVTMHWTFKTTTVVEGMVEVPPYSHVDAYDYSRREEAEQACLVKLIEIVKNK